MTTCSSCGAEYPEGFKFCGNCGSPLDTAGPGDFVAEERRVVTALFCDLVGFTATSEYADPEDVDQDDWPRTSRWLALEIEAFGGVVEKFIGDAVVGVFGVPAAHEDDPERAVRAGLAPRRGRRGHRRLSAAHRSICGLGSTPERRSCDSTWRRNRGRDSSRATRSTPLRGSSRSHQKMGVAVGLATFESTSAVFDYRGARAGNGERQDRARSGLPRTGHARQTRHRRHTDARHAIHRSRDRPGDPEGHLRQDDGRGFAAARDGRRRAGSREEPARGRTRCSASIDAQISSRGGRDDASRTGRASRSGRLGEILKAHAGILESDPPGVALSKLDAGSARRR